MSARMKLSWVYVSFILGARCNVSKGMFFDGNVAPSKVVWAASIAWPKRSG